VGRTVTLDGRPHQVLGVMPPGFRLATNFDSIDRARFWVPAALTPAAAARDRVASWHLVGRLRAGAALASADAEVRAVAERLKADDPGAHADKTFRAVGLRAQLGERVRPALTMLFSATLLLLTIASANMALLLSARAAARGGEAAVRAALGASRGRLVRQFLVEGALLALGGGLVGFALAFAGVDLAAAAYAAAAVSAHQARPDGRVLGFALALSAVAGVGASLWPAWRTSGARLHGLLKEGAARATAGGRGRRLQAGLLVAEVALSAVLLAASLAVAGGFRRALAEPLGFRAEGVLTFGVRLPASRYGSGAAAGEAVLARLRGLPGVSAAGSADSIPLGGATQTGGVEVEGVEPPPAAPGPWAIYQRAGGEYFRALGVPVLRGRGLTEADREGGAPVAVVNEAFARAYVPGGDALGRRVRWGDDEPWREIVGVVGDVRYAPAGGAAAPPVTYVPARQADASPAGGFSFFVVRAAGDPRALAGAARAAVAGLDADLPLADVKTYDERVRDSLADRRFTLALVAAFASSALVLTALGLFGLVSYQTRRRARELAIRMALGAASADVGRLVVRDTARLLLAGLALGLPAAFAAGKLLAARLEGVPPPGPLALAATAFVLGLVALLAALAPARLAARTPPAAVLRTD
jgi:predicted permease